MPTQNVNLTETLDGFVKEQVAGGHFNNASEVHRAALSLLAKQDEERTLRLQQLRQSIQAGDRDIEEDRLKEYESADAFFEDIVRY